MLHVLMLFVGFFTPLPDEPAPFLGITMVPLGEERRVNERVFSHGVRIDAVVPDSGAAQAGLLVGDIIVAADGVDFSVPTDQLVAKLGEAIRARKVGDTFSLSVVRDRTVQHAKRGEESADGDNALSQVHEWLRQADPGTVVEFHAERVRELVEITATLGARPVDAVTQPRTIPPIETLFPEGLPRHPAEALVEVLVDELNVRADYDDQRRRLAALVEHPDAYCLTRFASVMREPFAMPGLSRRLAEMPEDLPGMLAHAAEWLDQEAAFEPVELRTGLSAEEHAVQIEELLTRAAELRTAALEALTPDERKLLRATIDELADAVNDDIMIQRGNDKQRLERIHQFLQAARKIDMAKLIASAALVAHLADPAYIAGLQQDLAAGGAGVFLTRDTKFGKIIFAGAGSSWHQDSAAVLIDLGGDDFYTQTWAEPFCVVLDLGGNDEYAATYPRAVGSGRMSISLLYDHAGDDLYRTRRWGQGVGVLGVGILRDHAGDDDYRTGDFGQACALQGVGLLIDDAGDDRYDAERFAQGLGLPGGFAALWDRAGTDAYYCKGRDLGAYGTPGIFAGWGQGCGLGLRGVASGGVALLLDDKGDDYYEAGNFSQGGGYYLGWGALVDRAGNDFYLGSRYAQSFAAHQAIGFLEDEQGDDVYRTRRDVGQSCSWDETVSALIDDGGNDVYSAGGFALGAAAHNGIALFVDAGGQDVYEHNTGVARAAPNDYHGGTSLSLILDLGGGEDTYQGDQAPNNSIRTQPQHGFFADVRNDIPDAVQHFREWLVR